MKSWKTTTTTKLHKLITALLSCKFSSCRWNCVPLTNKRLPHNQPSLPVSYVKKRVKRVVIYNNHYLQIVAETRTFTAAPRLRTASTMTINSCLTTLAGHVSFRAQGEWLSIYRTQTIVRRKKFYTFLLLSYLSTHYHRRSVCWNFLMSHMLYVCICCYYCTLVFALAQFFNNTKQEKKFKKNLFHFACSCNEVELLYNFICVCIRADCVCVWVCAKFIFHLLVLNTARRLSIAYSCFYLCWLTSRHPFSCSSASWTILAAFATLTMCASAVVFVFLCGRNNIAASTDTLLCGCLCEFNLII